MIPINYIKDGISGNEAIFKMANIKAVRTVSDGDLVSFAIVDSKRISLEEFQEYEAVLKSGESSDFSLSGVKIDGSSVVCFLEFEDPKIIKIIKNNPPKIFLKRRVVEVQQKAKPVKKIQKKGIKKHADS
jgi:hypothetical protein